MVLPGWADRINGPWSVEQHAAYDTNEGEQDDEEQLAERNQEWDTYEDQEQDHDNDNNENDDPLQKISSTAGVWYIG